MKRFAIFLLMLLISMIGAKTFAASTYYYSWMKITGTYTFPSVTLNADYTSVKYTINACDGTTISISGSGYTTASYTRTVTISIDGQTKQTISLPNTQATVSINYSYRFTDSNSHEIVVASGGYDRVTLGTVTVTHPVSTTSDLNVALDAAGDLKYYVTESNKYHIKNMTISGPINGEDMAIIREMSSSEKAELTSLNLKNAQMVAGGGSCGTHYYEWSGSYGDYDDPTSTYTADGVINNGLFYNCDNLVDLILPESVTEIRYRAFYSCDNLNTVMIGNSTSKIGDQAFAYCKNLTTIRIPSIVTIIDTKAFYDCSSLTTISLPTSLKTIGEMAFFGTSLSSLTLPAGIENIYAAAFWGINITTVSFPSSLKGIYGFSGCKKLKTVTFQEGCRPSISPFNNCDNIEKTLVASVEDLCHFSFTGKHNLFAKGLYVNGVKITSLAIPEGTESIGPYAFCNCPQLTSVSFPSTIKSVKNSAFDGCTNISRVNAASLSAWCQINFDSSTEWVDVYDSNGQIAYTDDGDGGTTSIRISKSDFKSNPLYYAHKLFVDDNELSNLTIPADVETIGTGAFAYCQSLNTVEFPATVTHVKSRAFKGCNNIVSVTAAKKDSWNRIQFEYYNNNYGIDLGEKDWGEYNAYELLYNKDYSSNPIYATCTSSVTDFGNINWSSTDAAVASVNEEGVVTAKSAGTAMIVANSSGNRNFCTFVVNEGVSLVSEILLSESSMEMSVGQEKQLSATVLPESAANKTVRWSSDNTSVATVNNNGLVSGIGVGSATITVSSTDGSNISTACSVLVTELSSPNITFADANVKALCVANWDTDGDGELSEVEAAAVTDLGTVFKGKTNITSFDELQYFTGLTSIGSEAFYSCYGLTSVTIPNSVTSIGDGAFYNCYDLTSEIILNSVTSIGAEAFNCCYRLTSVTVPNSVTSIGSKAFFGCSGLTSVAIPNSVTSIGDGAFSACSGLTSISVASGNTKYDSRNNCNAIIETASNTLIAGCKNTTIPNSVTGIGKSAFSSCSSLKNVTIPNSVTSIGNSAFSACSGLTSVTIGNSVTSIGAYAFRECSSLISVTIPNSVTSIGVDAFYYCTGLTSVTIGSSVTSIGYQAFSRCSGLKSVTIPNSVTSIGDAAFSGCSGLTSVAIPNSVTSIGNSAFNSCSGLTSISVASGNTKYDSRNNCNAIIETASNTLIAGCKNTTIPSSVTSIGGGAFYGCSGLTSVTIPNSVTSIGDCAFDCCI
ncbi:MAG: leucine-rich repeat protein [Prevotella sp.]|nr:leucine-rich repeat protein [Prevotella sp.]